ncbi:hypothetical protein IK7_01977, partial [Bacillus cereus VD156]
FTAWIFSFEENLAIKNAPPIVRLCLTIGVHFTLNGFFYENCLSALSASKAKYSALIGSASSLIVKAG